MYLQLTVAKDMCLLLRLALYLLSALLLKSIYTAWKRGYGRIRPVPSLYAWSRMTASLHGSYLCIARTYGSLQVLLCIVLRGGSLRIPHTWLYSYIASWYGYFVGSYDIWLLSLLRGNERLPWSPFYGLSLIR
jgi:hypothetical protein